MRVAAHMLNKSEKTLMKWTKRATNRLEFFHCGKTPYTTREAIERVRVFKNGEPQPRSTNPAHEAAIKYLREVCGMNV